MQKKRNPATARPSKSREHFHAAGPRCVKLRLSDTDSESFRRKCERESLSLTNDPHETEVLDWIAKVSDSDFN
jgi:hypothetical protein